jgi:uncharacterized protein (DUF2141 family)
MGFISGSGTGCAAPIAALAISRAIMPARLPVLGVLALTMLGGAAPVADLSLDIGGLRSAKGLVRVCLTAAANNFPKCIDNAESTRRTAPADGGAIRFAGLPHGDYAIAVIHDENGNGKLDTIAGIPREGFGFSRNPPIRFGPPRFASARFSVTGTGERQQVTMRYLL